MEENEYNDLVDALLEKNESLHAKKEALLFQNWT